MRKVNITKDEFCKVVNKLERTWRKQSQIADVLGTVIDTGDLSDVVVDLLEKLMGLDPNDVYGSDIDYFCWELDFGKKWKPNMIRDVNNNSIDISTAEKLYDYLISD